MQLSDLTVLPAQVPEFTSELRWSELPPLPDSLGVAGPFVGTSFGQLVVAGGANFPDGPPWEGHPKVWHDVIYALDHPAGKWRLAGRLPGPLGYGISGNWRDALVCLGGSDAQGHHAGSFLIRCGQNGVELEELPPLPEPRAMAAGMVIGDTVYLAGGLSEPNSSQAASNFWALNLSKKSRRWQILETWPGPARILAVTGSLDDAFYLLSGAELMKTPEGTTTRRFLKDAYRYTPGAGWETLPDLPYSVVAAASPAFSISPSQLLVLGGDDGTNFARPAALRESHPGFVRQMLVYDGAKQTWIEAGELPATLSAPVTTGTTLWNGRMVIPSGEIRPGVRTPQVLSAE